MLSRTNELLGSIPLGRMSPLTAVAFLLESVALLFLLSAPRRRQAPTLAALLAAGATAINVVVLVGYAYGVPVLYGGPIIPTALPTAVAFVLVGAGEIGLAAPGIPALRSWSGTSTRGILLRALLPFMLFFVLFQGWLDLTLQPILMPNPALWQSLLALTAGVLVVIITGWIARRTGGEIEQAQTALRGSEARYKLLFEQNPLPMWVYDTASLRLLAVNSAAIRHYGYARDEFLAMTIRDIRPPEELPRLQDYLARTRQPQERSGSWKHRKKDGTVIDVEIFSHDTLFLDRPARLVLANDITDRKRAEESTATSELKYRRLFEAAKDGILILNAETGAITDVNPFLFELLGYSHAELLGRHLWEIGLFKDIAANKDSFLELQTKGYVRYENLPLETKDGRRIWVEFVSNAYEAGGSQIVQCNIRDITERKRAEAAEREQRTLAEALRDTAAALSSTLDFDEVLERILLNADRVVPHRSSSIMLVEGGFLRTAKSRGYAERGLETWLMAQRFPMEIFANWEIMSQTRQPLVVADTREFPGWRELPEMAWIRSHVAAPIVVKQRVIGFINLDSDQPGYFTPDHGARLQAFADQAAIALENAQLVEGTRQQVERLAALHAIDLAIASSLDLRVTLTVVFDQVMTQLGVDAADILLLHPQRQVLEFASGRGFRTQAFQAARLRLGEGYAGRAALERRSIHIPHLADQTDNPRLAKHLVAEGFSAYYGVPLIAKGQVVGVLEVFQRSPLPSDAEWVAFLETLAGQAAIAIEIAQLFDGLQRSNLDLALAYDATIEGWSRALDLRDKETEGHTLRVTDMTERLARAMGLRDEELLYMHRGGLLHDIGKMGVPDAILFKPGPLSAEEWVSMRKHPVYAYEMLAPITYLRPALDIPYCHHEKWDGSGYPRGLKGEQIPLAARLFAVVDVWDALRSDRPYRPAWPEEKVRAHIQSLAGTHFDPQAVQTFLNVVEGA